MIVAQVERSKARHAIQVGLLARVVQVRPHTANECFDEPTRLTQGMQDRAAMPGMPGGSLRCQLSGLAARFIVIAGRVPTDFPKLSTETVPQRDSKRIELIEFESVCP